MIKTILINHLVKLATKKIEDMPPPLHPMAVIRAQNMRLPPELVRNNPGKAVDMLLSNIRYKKIPEIHYKTAAQTPSPQALSQICANAAQQRQIMNRFARPRPLQSITERWVQNHAVRNPDILDGEGKNVLSMDTKQNILNPANLGRPGRGDSQVMHRFFSY